MATLGALGIAAIATSAVSTGLGVYSSVQAGKAQSEAAEFNAQVAENNAIASRQQAASEARQTKRRNRLRSASRKARFAASGVQLSGSVEDVLFDSAVQDELDRMSALYRGELRASASTSQAGAFRAEGKNARTTSFMNAGGTLLGGASDALSIGANPNFRKDS